MRNIKIVDIRSLDNNVFYHYTSKNNLDNIDINGLEPRIGDNAIGIEKNEKIFFTIGITNSLILMESWIRWLIAKSPTEIPTRKIRIPFYRLCCFILRIPIFKPLLTLFVKIELKIKLKKINAYKKLKNILDNSVYLKLDLEREFDYSFNDIDEVKNRNFDRKLLNLMYPHKSNVNDTYMEYWNMHTIPKHTIPTTKINLVKIGESFKASDILEYMVKHSEIKIKKELPFLYGYLKWLKNNK